MDRTGVAPVLAIIILTAVGIAAVATAGAFLLDLQLGVRDLIAPEQVSMDAISTTCAGSTVNMTLVHTGQEDLSGDNASALLYESDTLLATEEVRVEDKNFTRVGGIDDISIEFTDCSPDCMDPGTFYRAEIAFPVGYTLRSTCYAE